jgi:hypothetical protein
MSGPVPNTEVEAAAIGRRFNGNDKDLMKYGAPHSNLALYRGGGGREVRRI